MKETIIHIYKINDITYLLRCTNGTTFYWLQSTPNKIITSNENHYPISKDNNIKLDYWYFGRVEFSLATSKTLFEYVSLRFLEEHRMEHI